jgi:L,D-transpeptidase YcbB
VRRAPETPNLAPRLFWALLAAATALSAAGPVGCGRSVRTADIARQIRTRLSTLDRSASVLDEPLLEPKAVERFYKARKGRPAWPDGNKVEQIVEAIRGIERDGLSPADYHLASIEKALDNGKGGSNAALEADLDLLVTDAVAGMLDHIQYGRIRPVLLNPNWNVDPREGAPPLEGEIAEAARAGSPREAIEGSRPRHFIYEGLVRTLGELREIQAHGGWPSVPAGRPIRPGTADPRIPAVRARLRASGEISGSASTSTRYDPALRQGVALFQERHRLDPTGIIDAKTVEEMNVSAAARIGQVRVNLERARWVLGRLGQDFLLVNLPAFKGYLIRGGKNVWEARTQIGEEAMQTPTFRAKMTTVVFNPDWTVPPTILAKEVIEPLQNGDDVLTRKGLVVYDAQNEVVDPSSIDWSSVTPETFPYTIRQPPGTDNALGRVKFLFPNSYSIYLHDTPNLHLFDAQRRTFSHGCIRIENPLELAQILLAGQDDWGPAKIEETLATGEKTEVPLEHRIPVLIVYWTVTVGASGEVKYAQDIYNLDAPLFAALVRGSEALPRAPRES